MQYIQCNVNTWLGTGSVQVSVGIGSYNLIYGTF